MTYIEKVLLINSPIYDRKVSDKEDYLPPYGLGYIATELVKELVEYSKTSLGTFRASAFQFRPYHGTELYNRINKEIKYAHNDNLNKLSGRKQFNFTAGNFSECSNELIEELVIKTNSFGEVNNNDQSNKRM